MYLTEFWSCGKNGRNVMANMNSGLVPTREKTMKQVFAELEDTFAYLFTNMKKGDRNVANWWNWKATCKEKFRMNKQCKLLYLHSVFQNTILWITPDSGFVTSTWCTSWNARAHRLLKISEKPWRSLMFMQFDWQKWYTCSMQLIPGSESNK